MTDTVDTSAEAVAAVIRGLRPMNGSNQMDDGVALITALAAERDKLKAETICSGCGCVEDLPAILARNPKTRSCCPERDMLPITRDDVSLLKTERNALRLAVAEARNALDEAADIAQAEFDRETGGNLGWDGKSKILSLKTGGNENG